MCTVKQKKAMINHTTLGIMFDTKMRNEVGPARVGRYNAQAETIRWQSRVALLTSLHTVFVTSKSEKAQSDSSKHALLL